MSDRELERLKLNALAEFAAGAGHEINNPLTVISGHAEVLLKNADPEQRYHLSVIIAQTRRAYEMIADIRLFARPPRPQWQVIELKKFLTELINDQREADENQKISFTCRLNDELFLNEGNGESDSAADLADRGGINFNKDNKNLDECADNSNDRPGLPLIFESDPAQLRTIFGALIKNSREAFAEESGKIDLAAIFPVDWKTDDAQDPSSDQAVFQFVLEDNGPGIPEEFREQIFSPYFSGRSAGRGLGFGLPKSWRFLDMLGGSIRYVKPKQFKTGCGWLIELPVKPIRITETDR